MRAQEKYVLHLASSTMEQHSMKVSRIYFLRNNPNFRFRFTPQTVLFLDFFSVIVLSFFFQGDVVGTYLDLESEPKSLKYTKNGEDLGVAMSLTINLDEKPLFPHILVRNMAVELNFGENENPWNETLEGFTLLQNADEEHTVQLSTKPIPEDTQPEVIMLKYVFIVLILCFEISDCGDKLSLCESFILSFELIYL